LEPSEVPPMLSAYQHVKLYPDLEQGVQTLLTALQRI